MLLLLIASLLFSTSISANTNSDSYMSDTPKECLPYTQQRTGSFVNEVASDNVIFPSQSAKYINLKYMPKEKLMFCLIPKVASSYFIRLFSRIAGVPFKDRKAKKRLPLHGGRGRERGAHGDSSGSDAHTMESLRQGRYEALPSFDSGRCVTAVCSVCVECHFQ